MMFGEMSSIVVVCCVSVMGSPVSQQGQGVTGGLLVASRDVGGPGSES